VLFEGHPTLPVKRAFPVVKMEIPDAIKHSLGVSTLREKLALFCASTFAALAIRDSKEKNSGIRKRGAR